MEKPPLKLIPSYTHIPKTILKGAINYHRDTRFDFPYLNHNQLWIIIPKRPKNNNKNMFWYYNIIWIYRLIKLSAG